MRLSAAIVIVPHWLQIYYTVLEVTMFDLFKLQQIWRSAKLLNYFAFGLRLTE